jgi:hypothetical protein
MEEKRLPTVTDKGCFSFISEWTKKHCGIHATKAESWWQLAIEADVNYAYYAIIHCLCINIANNPLNWWHYSQEKQHRVAYCRAVYYLPHVLRACGQSGKAASKQVPG